MLTIYRRFCSGPNPVGRFLTIYIEEAHAIDAWYLPKGGYPDIRQHVTLDDRIAAANLFVKNLDFPIETVVDCIRNETNFHYRAVPERLYIVMNGVVVYQGGKGPFTYRLDEVLAWFEKRYEGR